MLCNIILWLNNNSGAVMALLTFVYVVATIFICIFNYKSASATREQIKESQRQFEESNRAHVVPRFTVLEGQLYCLTFHNIGKSMADHLKIQVSSEWLDCLRRTKNHSKTADTLSHLSEIEIFLPPDDKYSYPICVIADGTGDFALLCEKPLTITISYRSGGKAVPAERFELPIKDIDCLANASDYVRMEQKKRKALEGLESQLKKIANKDFGTQN